MQRPRSRRVAPGCLLTLFLLTAGLLPPSSWAYELCTTINGGLNPGQEIYAGVTANFIGSGSGAFHYRVGIDEEANVNGGHTLRLVHGADAQGEGGTLFFQTTNAFFKTHYEGNGGIDIADVSGPTIPLTPLFIFGGTTCRDSEVYVIPAGVENSTEVCDGLDNDNDATVDDVPGGCNAQPIPVTGTNPPQTALDSVTHAVNECPSSSGGPVLPCTGNTFNTRFGFEARSLPLFEVSSPGIPLRLALHYNNRNERPSAIPGRWFTNFDISLTLTQASGPARVAVSWPDGTQSLYETPSGTIFTGVLSDGSFVEEFFGGGKVLGWDLHYRDGLVFHFSAAGILQSITDGKSTTGNTLTIAHEDASKPSIPTKINDNYGHEIVLAYGTSGPELGSLVSITEPGGGVYDLAYQDFLLKTVTLPAPDPGKPRPSYELTYEDLPGFDQGEYKGNLTRIQFHPDAANPDVMNDRVIGKWNYDHSSRVESEEGPGGALGKTVDYNASNTVVTDARGNATTYGFDFASGLTLTTTAPCESCAGGTATSTLVRNAQGQITSRTDFRGTQTTWANHDLNGDPGTVTQAVSTPEMRTTTFTYHPELHTPLSIVRPSAVPTGTNKVTIFDYEDPATAPADPPLNPSADLNPADFNDPANLTRLVHRVIESGWTRDVAGSAVRVAHVTKFTYDSLGRVTNIDGPRSSTPNDDTDFAYYADDPGQGAKRGQLQKVTNALGQETTFNSYDALGNVLSVTDPNGLVTTFTYDAAGRVRTITQVGAGVDGGGQPIDLVTEYVYEANGNLDYIRLPRGNFINYQFDAADRLVSITRTATEPPSPTDTPAGETLRYGYDSEGNRTREEVAPGVSAPEVRFTEFEYDALNRLAKVFNPVFGELPSATVFRRSTYDANGNRTALALLKDAGTTQLRHTAFAFDPLNRLEDVTQDDGSPSGVTTAYVYDVQDNLRTLTDGKSHDTDYATDDFGRQVEVVSPDTGTTRFEYDPAGNLIEKSQNALVTQYTYDALNRLTLVHFPSASSQDLAYTYDTHADAPPKENGVGRLVRITDASGRTYFSYDKRGNVALEERQQGSAVLNTTYAWDENGNLIVIKYPSGRKVTYNYYNAPNDQPILVGMVYQGQNQALATGITYEPFGSLASLRNGNGLKETRTYDAAGQIDLLSVAPDTGSPVLSLDYTFDETGNITSIADPQDAQKNKSYTYDALDRLDTASIGGLGSFDYDYDAVGNRTREEHDMAVTTYTLISTNNQIGTLSGATTADFEYDDHGNTTTDGTLTFTYHPTHQLKEVTDQAPTVLGSYQYDGQSRRMAKTAQGLTRLFAYDTSAQMLGEYDDAGNVLKEYAYLGTQRLVMVDHDRDDEGVRDEADNCSAVQNVDQVDGDTDLLGDVCDSAPSNPDRDGDGLLDGQEDADKDGQVSAGETDPDNEDTDGDTFSDGDEVTAGTDPLNPNSYPGAPSAIPALSVMGVVIFLVLFAVGRFWTLRRRWSKVGRGMDLMVLALGLTLMAPQAVTPQGGGAPERVLYIHTDHIGTAQKLTDVAQQVVWEAQAEAFGKTTVTAQSTVFNLRFPGQYEDRETGLFYNYLRTHNPGTGGYLQPDPLGVVTGANVYAYVDSNPLRRFDPTGEFFTPDTILDAGFLIYDAYRLFADNVFGSCENLGTNLSALGADSLAFIIPAVTGAGVGVRAAARAAEAELRASKTAAALRRAEQAADIGSLTKGAGPTTSMSAARGGAGPVWLGQIGEELAGITGPKSRIPSATGTADFRVPDELTDTALREVKNVQRLRTGGRAGDQLRDFSEFARPRGLECVLCVRQGTQISPRSQQFLDELGFVVERKLP